MNVEVVADKMPLRDQGVGSHTALDVCDEIFFVAGLAGRASDQFSTRHIEVADQRQRAMPDIFKLTPRDFAWAHRQVWMFALQSLHPGHFGQTFGALALFGARGCFLIHRVDLGDFFVKAFFISRSQPVAAQVRLELSVFLKASPHGGARFH